MHGIDDQPDDRVRHHVEEAGETVAHLNGLGEDAGGEETGDAVDGRFSHRVQSADEAEGDDEQVRILDRHDENGDDDVAEVTRNHSLRETVFINAEIQLKEMTAEHRRASGDGAPEIQMVGGIVLRIVILGRDQRLIRPEND